MEQIAAAFILTWKCGPLKCCVQAGEPSSSAQIKRKYWMWGTVVPAGNNSAWKLMAAVDRRLDLSVMRANPGVPATVHSTIYFISSEQNWANKQWRILNLCNVCISMLKSSLHADHKPPNCSSTLPSKSTPICQYLKSKLLLSYIHHMALPQFSGEMFRVSVKPHARQELGCWESKQPWGRCCALRKQLKRVRPVQLGAVWDGRKCDLIRPGEEWYTLFGSCCLIEACLNPVRTDAFVFLATRGALER